MSSKPLGLITQEIQNENWDLKVLGKFMTNRHPNGLSAYLGDFVVYTYLSFEVEVTRTFPSLLAPPIKHWIEWANIQDPTFNKPY